MAVPFSPGRTDASQELTRCALVRRTGAGPDAFRNYRRNGEQRAAEELLLDRAQLLTLAAPEMTVLLGGMRALNTNFGQSTLRKSRLLLRLSERDSAGPMGSGVLPPYFIFNSAKSTTVISAPQFGQVSRAGNGVYWFIGIGIEQRSHS